MKIAYVMFGAPGSGKSSWLKKNVKPPVTICSADHWFMDWDDESYHFDPSELTNAHNNCLKQYCIAVEKGEYVACDNTNTTLAEIAPYIQIPLAFGYLVRPIYALQDRDACVEHNIHAVPPIVIDRMVEQAAALADKWIPYWPEYATTEDTTVESETFRRRMIVPL